MAASKKRGSVLSMTIHLRFSFLCVFMMMMHWCIGQHGMQSSLNMFDRYAFNPAFGGMESSLAANLQYRTQWAGIPGNPETYMVNAHMPFYLWQGAVGLELFKESIGAENQNAFLVSYNYIRETPIGLFSLGLRAGISQKSLDGTKLRAPGGFYEGTIIDHQDINLPNGAVSGISPLVETGLYFAGDYFETGLSMTGYYPGGISLGDGIHYNPRTGFNFFGEYFIETFDQISLYPVVFIKTDLVETQAELSVRAEWESIATAGIGYRGFGNDNLDALILSAGVRLSSKFYLHYAYDIGLSRLNSAHQGTHELLIRYNLGKMIGAGLPPRTIYNPRNL
ncbi:MAG TPA: PorP/SprF family type IX secretion system membrane protein [Saprospiraceae bacterium]|nr:PorP/SprF family type IX secretion system membrane protein [Saprospiraceae bacterium]